MIISEEFSDLDSEDVFGTDNYWIILKPENIIGYKKFIYNDLEFSISSWSDLKNMYFEGSSPSVYLVNEKGDDHIVQMSELDWYYDSDVEFLIKVCDALGIGIPHGRNSPRFLDASLRESTEVLHNTFMKNEPLFKAWANEHNIWV